MVTLDKFAFTPGDAIEHIDMCDYGFITRAPYTHAEFGTVVDVRYFTRTPNGWQHDDIWQAFPDSIAHTHGCECGNPWSLCHPEA